MMPIIAQRIMLSGRAGLDSSSREVVNHEKVRSIAHLLGWTWNPPTRSLAHDLQLAAEDRA
ncbi:hypothetical protein ACICHK_26830 [Streptomyces sp. AHU1]|uniref:hypothetical protein n=1 Tax=Streptomyces sp. AHU1 TaxID=3377215 RepID=UPI003877E85E